MSPTGHMTPTRQIIATVSLKGGVGKSSIAWYLAHEFASPRRSVAVLDLDPGQHAIERLAAWCDSPPPFSVTAFDIGTGGAARFRQMIEQSEAEMLILDTAPQLSDAAMVAALVADLALVPCGPSMLDLRSARDAVDLCRQARGLRDDGGPLVSTVPSGVRGGTRYTEELPRLLAAMEEPVAPMIGHRVEIPRRMIEGRPLRPSSPSAKEFRRLARHVLRRMKR